MAFTEFYCTSLGSNLNSGGINSGIPGGTANYTHTNGNWSTVLNNFTVQNGTNPTGNVTVGDYASIYNDGATVGVYIARITAVDNKVNGNISVSSTNIYGTAPTTSTTNRSMKVGGAWLGPNGSTTFPFGLTGTIASLSPSVSSNAVRVNAKNDQTYTMTAALNLGTLGAAILQGYTTTPGDLGKSIFSSNIISASNFTITGSASQSFADLIFVSTGASNANHLVQTGNPIFLLRCVFHGSRASGFLNAATSAPVFLLECEAYDCNKSNSTGTAGFETSVSGATLVCINCYSHDHAGSNSQGFSSVANSGALILINCISESNGGSGLLWNNAISSASTGLVSINSDYYNNTGDGIKLANTVPGLFAYFSNNNFIKNGGKGINNTLAAQSGIIYNNGRGAGTQANGSTDTLGAIIDTSTDITYVANSTPWNAPTTGDFRIVLAGAKNSGRSHFEETDGTNTGTVGFPDIGAAEHYDTQKSQTFGG